MSVSASTRTKSLSGSEGSESTEQPLIQDRWTNNITYRQLVMSSCIGILQLWWHPYVHDLRRLIPFMFLYNIFTLVVGYPMFYLELALGAVTKKGVLNCWDLAPSARGIGITMLLTTAFTALSMSTISCYSLSLFVHSWHSFPPWLQCAAGARPACAARHRALSGPNDVPPQSAIFNLLLNLRRDNLENGLGNIVWELAVYFAISWLIIYFIAIKKIYSYSKLVLFKDVLAFFTLVTCAVGAFQLDGAAKMFQLCDWGSMFEGFTMWREAIEYSLVELSVSTGSTIMLGAHCPKERPTFGTTTALAVAVCKCSSMVAALTLGAVHGALRKDYDADTNIWPGASSSLVLWAELSVRSPGSQFWSGLIFFTLFVLSVTSAALMVQTIMSSFTGRSLRKISWAFLILICFLFCFIGTFTLCSQGGLYVLNSLLAWPVSRPRVITSALTAIMVTYGYGQKTFCEDLFLIVEEYPCVLFRVCWAVVPVFLLLMFAATSVVPPSAAAGWMLVLISLLPILVILLFYLFFKCRVRNIVRDEK